MDTVGSIQEKLEGVMEREILSKQNFPFRCIQIIPPNFLLLLCKVTRNADIRWFACASASYIKLIIMDFSSVCIFTGN